jgi:transposase
MDIPSCLFADPASTECYAIVVDEATPKITLQVTTTAVTATCPKCHAPSCRIHSHYTRTLADLPWAGIPVRIELTARRFVCENPDYDQDIFTERLVQLAAPWARRTERLSRLQQQIGCSTGASCGSRLCTALGMPVGIDALLTLIRHVRTGAPCELHIIGVDDWAKRKGQCYGTIIVDHERGDIVDLLPDRTPETLAAWLRGHPEIEVIIRDRAEAYAQGIREGAPTAIQVADRFHLLKNLSDALFRILQQHHVIIEARLKPNVPGIVLKSALFSSATATPTMEGQADDPGTPVLAGRYRAWQSSVAGRECSVRIICTMKAGRRLPSPSRSKCIPNPSVAT